MIQQAKAGGSLEPRGVLVVGMGDETRGDGGIGLHLMRCLAQLDWPGSVVFTPADDSIPERAERFARVILIDAVDGPSTPGTLYQVDPEELLACSLGGEGSGLGLLTMLPARLRRRVSIFGVQPGDTRWGAAVSSQVLACLPLLLPYLRARILTAARDLTAVN